MKISDQDIVRAARQLRDEENEQLHVRPWRRKRHFEFPAWLAAIPAAAVAGFLLGVWTNSHSAAEQPLTALVDTVYIKVKDRATNTDSTRLETGDAPHRATSSATWQKTPQVHHANRARRIVNPAPAVPTGRSMSEDNIRYDLLVKN